IFSLDAATGRMINHYTRSNGYCIPRGARGVCIDSSHAEFDEVWVACFGLESASGRHVVRIIDVPGAPRVQVIRLGGDPTAFRGPFGICASVTGDKYVACGNSGEVWKIPSNVDDFLRPEGFRTHQDCISENTLATHYYLPDDAVPNWPIRFGGRESVRGIG